LNEFNILSVPCHTSIYTGLH